MYQIREQQGFDEIPMPIYFLNTVKRRVVLKKKFIFFTLFLSDIGSISIVNL